MNVSKVADNVVQVEEGLWSAHRQSAVSYPKEGNDHCFALEDDSYWFQHRNRVIVHLVRTFPPSGTVFDVGGGNGCVAAALLRSGIDTVLVDPGLQGVLNARRRGVPLVIHSAFQDAGFREGAVSAVGLFDCLEHVEDELDFLQRLHACLTDYGWLYLTVPAFQTLWSRDDEYAGHFRRYRTRPLARTLGTAGFEVRYCSYFFSILAPAVLLFRSLPSRLGLRRPASGAASRAEHTPPPGLRGRLLRFTLAMELRRIAAGKRLPFGSSCIVAARKAPLR